MYLKTISVLFFSLLTLYALNVWRTNIFALVNFGVLSALKHAKIYLNLCFFFCWIRFRIRLRSIVFSIVCRAHYVFFLLDPKLQTPNHFLLSVMLNAPLPLWTPTVHVRGKNYRYKIILVWEARWPNVQRIDHGRLERYGFETQGGIIVLYSWAKDNYV